MNQLHEQNLHLAQKIERVAARLEELARTGPAGISPYAAAGARGFGGYGYNGGLGGQGNTYYNNNRYLDGPNSASYLDNVRRDDGAGITRGRYNDPALGGGRTGGLRGDDRSWGRDETDKMDTASEDKK